MKNSGIEMRIVALLTVRNEEAYLRRCLRHLLEQGVEACVIDNDSTDGSRAIAEEFLGRGVCLVERLPYRGYFDLIAQCDQQQELASHIPADWFIHHDADEIMQAPAQFASLSEGIAHADAQGFNAINFDQFVFVPVDDAISFEGTDYVASMKHYYFFEPHKTRLVRAWKGGSHISLSKSAGHIAGAEGQRIFPDNFILRHYIALSADYAREKYRSRQFSSVEVARGWHGWRATFEQQMVRMPAPGSMHTLGRQGHWNRCNPQHHHLFIRKDPR